MKNSELFRKTAKALIDKMPKGTQVRIADQLGISRPYMNDFLNGRKMLSESKREEIAEKLGYSYIDFLTLGREMFSEQFDDRIFQKQEIGEYKIDSTLLNKIIAAVEKGLIKMRLEMQTDKKSQLITLLYEHFCGNQNENIEPQIDKSVKGYLRLVA